MSDLDRYQYGYDQNSNRLYKANVVGTAAVPAGLDEGYAYDALNRLTQMQRGVLSGGVITGTPSREMDYTLDPTGNWTAYLTKTSGTTDLNQGRTQNPVNEITDITANGGTPLWVTPAYDDAGNTTTFPQPASPTSSYTAVYDAWNRLVSISDTGGTVATYQYDGTNRRIVKDTIGISETRHFYFTNGWQDVEERVGASTAMDKQYVWGTRYIDELICRDDATPARYYAMQDANFNLTSICDTSGMVQERYLFDPYGNRTVMNASWSILSDSTYDWVIGFQGLMEDVEIGLVYVRNRYIDPSMGRMMQRDHDGYSDSLNLYEYVRNNPIILLDSTGFAATTQPTTQPSGGLTFTTITPPTGGDCGDVATAWRVQWMLANKSTIGGWIIQHVVVKDEITDCDGKTVLYAYAKWWFNGAGLWEAWQVKKDQTITVNAQINTADYDDNYHLVGGGSCTKGKLTITGTAEFYEGLKLPGGDHGFHVHRPWPSRALPATKYDPGKLPGGTGSKIHQMTIEWNCCPKDHTETSKITHND